MQYLKLIRKMSSKIFSLNGVSAAMDRLAGWAASHSNAALATGDFAVEYVRKACARIGFGLMPRSWADVILALYTPNSIGDVLGEYGLGN